ncbi:MAG: TonB-dependent receptor [Chitinophagaceae bacterium]
MRMNRFGFKPILLLFTFLIIFQWASAQTGVVKGNVKDASGAPLAGASVTVQGKKNGTVTDVNGNYSLTLAPGKYSLLLSFVGQKPQKADVVITADATTEQNFTTESSADLDNVVVIGSRVRDVRAKTTTPVPVDVIRIKEITNFAQGDVGQILTYAAPSFQANRQTVVDGTDHIDPASLRGLGPDQTLVLLNGKRRHNTALVNINGSVGRGSVGTDLNSIPAAAIDHLEVLRDGAAAQYGSDAIAGVINVVLKKNYKGFNITGTLGENFTTQKLPRPQDLSIEKRNIVDGVNKQIDFDWGMMGKNNSYLNISGQWLQRGASNRGGIDNSPLLYYGNASLPTPPAALTTTAQKTDFLQWLMNQDAALATQRGFDRKDMIIGNSYSNNFLGFINAGTDLSSKVSLYLTAGIGHRKGDATGNYRLPAALSQQPVNADGSLYYPNGFLPHISPKINDLSGLIGANIKLGEWNMDISSVTGSNSFQFFVTQSGNASLAPTGTVQTSFDAGKLSFLQNTNNVDFSRKFNLVKAGDYFNVAFGGEARYEQFKITAGEPNSYILGTRTTSGTPFTTPVYPGTNSTYTLPAATATAPGAQVFPGYGVNDAINAHRMVYALYLDLEAKLNKWTLGGALRFEDYAEQNGINYSNVSGKVTARYEVSPELAFRGSLSNGFRAPSLHQRYFQNTSTQFVNSVAQNTLTVNNQNPISRTAFGIGELKPETSKDITLGVVGKIGRNFSYTVDAYLIRINDRIVLSTAFSKSNPLVQAIFTQYNVDPSVSSVQFWTNAVNTQTKGIDIVLTQKVPLNKGTLNFSLAGNLNKNEVVGPLHASSTIQSAANNPSQSDASKNPANDFTNILFDRQQRSRIEVAQPKSKFNFTTNYSLAKWNFMLRMIYWGKVEYVNAVNNNPFAKNATTGAYFYDAAPESDQVFSAKVTTDIAFTYKPTPAISVTAGANNLFDVYPDQQYIDPRNTLNTVYGTPTVTTALGTTKAVGGYNASRDASSRGRFLYFPNQFGFNGRYIYAKLSIEVGQLLKKK